MSKELHIVVAMSAIDRAIGKDNKLPWRLPIDMRNFRQLTTNRSVIMGRKTHESIGKPLPNRQNIVISNTLKRVEGCQVVSSLEEAIETATALPFVIGGEAIYKLALPIATDIWLTEVEIAVPDADTHFPDLGEDWRKTHERYDEENSIKFAFKKYRKI